jgi:hypothetical protein
MTGLLDFVVEALVLIQPAGIPRGRVDHQVQAVQLEPHLGGNDLADAPGILARGAQAGEDGVGILGVESEEFDNVALGGNPITFAKLRLVARDGHRGAHC